MKTTDFLPFVDKFILLSVNSYWKLRFHFEGDKVDFSLSPTST